MIGPEPLDPQALAPYRAIPGPDGRPLLHAIVAAARADLPGALAVLDQTLASMDLPALRAQAHRLKGASCSYGAAQLSACAKELEVAAAEGHAEACPCLLEALKAEAAKVLRALADLDA